ncbi:MAG: hypothetical protein R3C11_01140 [Planctomycetaceae bacterium]
MTGSLGKATYSKGFAFSATTGEEFQFYADSWTGSSSATWRLLDPQGETLFDNNIFTDETGLRIPQTGTYTLLLEGAPGDTTPSVSYGFDVIKLTESSTSLTLGSETSGSISAGETDIYTFTLAGDDYVYFHPYSTEATTEWQLVNAAGVIIPLQGFDEGDHLQKLTAGDYEVRISKTGLNSGDYDFKLTAFGGATAMTVDTQVDATLSPAQTSLLYQFSATAGDQFSFDSISWNGASGARWSLYNELGQQLFDDVVGNDQATMTLTSAGDYSLILTGDPTDTATDPQFSFEVISQGTATANTLTGTALSLSTPVSGTISTNGEIDKFTFTLTGTTRIFLDAISVHSSSMGTDPELMYWKLENEYETLLDLNYFYDSGENNFDNGAQFIELPAGDYQLSVAISSGGSQDTGNYNFQVLDLDSPVSTLTVGTAYNGSLTAANQVQSYQFTADAGDKLFFERQALSGSLADWTLIDPLGNILFSQSMSINEPDRLIPYDGTYTLLLEPASAAATFTMLVEDEYGSNVTASSMSTVYNTTLGSKLEVDHYSFTLTEDHLVLFDAQTNSGNLKWSLAGPAGDLVSAQAFNTTMVPIWLSAGSYDLSVQNHNSSSQSYKFQLIDLDAASSVTIGASNTGALSPANSTQAFKVSASAGDWLELGISITDIASFQTYDSRGNLINDLLVYHEGGSHYSGDGERWALPETGEYYIVLQGAIGETASSNSYDFSLDLYYPPISINKNLSWNTPVSDTLINKGEEHEYFFQLPINSMLNFDSLTNNANIAWKILNSSSTQVAGSNFAAGDTPASLAAGDYTLVIDGTGAAIGSYSFQLNNLLTTSTYIAPSDTSSITGTLSPATSSLAYQFQAANGESFDFEAVGYTGSSSASWKLVDSSGTILFDNAITTDESGLTVSSTGSFWLLIDGDPADSTTDPEFEFNFKTATSGGGGGSYTLNGTSISLNTTVSGSVVTGTPTEYNFTLSSDSLVYFDTLHQTGNSDENLWSLEGAAGSYVTDRSFDGSNAGRYTGSTTGLVFPLPAGGYNLTVENPEEDDSFQYRIIDLPSAASTFTLSSTVSGTLSPSRETDVYKFDVNAAEQYEFDALTTSYHSYARWRLIDPDGEILFSYNLATDVSSIQLDKAGTYYLLIEGASRDSSASRNYSFEVNYLGQGSVPATPLTLDTNYSGTLASSSQVDEYTFTLAGTTNVFFDSFTNNADFEWVLEDDSSNVIISATSFTASDGNDVTNANLLHSLSAGDYVLKIQSTNSATGSYGFRLADFDSASSAISGGSTGIQQLIPGNSTNLHTLSVTAGDRLHITPTLWTGSTQGQYRLMTSSGTVLTTGSLTEMHIYDVLTTETLTLLVEGDVADVSGLRSYQLDFEAIDITTTSTMSLDGNGVASVTGNISTAGDIHEYTLTTSTTPLRLYFEWVGTNADLNLRLKDSTGKTVLTDDYETETVRSNISTITLAANETYSFLIDSGLTTTGGYAFRVLDLDAQPDLEFDVDTIGSWSTATERDIYHFSAQKDDRLFIRMSVWGTVDELEDNIDQILDDIANQNDRGLEAEWEDGYATISGALHDMIPREYATRQFVLITDEDRDAYYPSVNKDFIEHGLLKSVQPAYDSEYAGRT